MAFTEHKDEKRRANKILFEIYLICRIWNQTHQQMNRHKTRAIRCVFPEASLSTRVAIEARHDGHVRRVEFGPTLTVFSN